MRVAWHRMSIADIASKRFWQIALLTTAGAIGMTSQADAALFYWSYPPGSEPGFFRPAPMVQPRRPKLRHPAKKDEPVKETANKPHGPLIIAVSINHQRVKIYDANGLFAEAPVSTGMRGHPTPTGVFSVIQKQKWHRSNIYSNAPMPYMQRITWSGIALHAGVLPGYPASHGCIRMPPAFAVKMYGWTRMGARVLVTPGELAPESFSHPLLPAVKVQPQPPVEALETNAPVAAKADKGAPDSKPAISEAKLDLQPAVAHNDSGDAAKDGAAATPPTGGQSRTADAASDPGAAGPKPAIADALAKADVAAPEPKTDAAAVAPKVQGSDAAQKADATKLKPAGNVQTADAKDQTRLPDAIGAAAAKQEPPKRTGQIAAFISRKDSKLYVRQNFAPLFEVPVTIAPSDRPLGTHVFTAEVDKNDPNVLHWTVVSPPASARGLAAGDDHLSRRHRRAIAATAEAKPQPVPDSPAEALDRITIPADAMARVAEALTTGGSIIVSDQGINQGETGEGTDFIVSLH